MYSDPSGHWLEGLKQGLSNISAVVVNEYKYAKNEVSAGINYVKNKFSAGIDAVQAFARNTTNEVAQYVDEKVVPKVKQGVSTTRQSITNGLNKGKSYAQKMKSQARSYAKKGCEGLSVIGSGGLGNIDSQGTGKTEPINRWDYLASSGKQIVLGNYTNDVTALGTAGQIGTGLLGIDLPLDIRDLFYDVNKWEWSWSHAGKTTLDTAGLLPVIGGLKYTDEAAALLKGGAGKTVKDGEFSIINWENYPEKLPQPEGPFRLIQGDEYDAARATANRANQSIHAADPSLKGMQIHEIQPVKFDGSPTDISNKIPLSPLEHAGATTWWRMIQRGLEK